MNARERLATLAEAMEAPARQVIDYLPNLFGAALLLLVGWVVARLLRAWTNRSFARLNRLLEGRSIRRDVEAAGADRLATEAAGLVVFWLVLSIFVAAAGEVLGLAVVTTGLSRLANYLPNVLGAALVVLAALVVANLARRAIGRAADKTGVAYGPAFGEAARAVILLVAGVIALDQLGVDSQLLIEATSILVASVFGGTALAFALGSRTAVGNILALHYVTQTYSRGQRIRLGDLEGEIVDFKKNGVVLACAEGHVLVPAREFSETRSTLVSGETR